MCILLKHTSNEVALCKFNGVWCFLTVSQFTLYGILKGNKPDFHVAMPPQMAKPFYASLVERFQKSYNPSAIKGRVCFFSICFQCFSVRLLCDVIYLSLLKVALSRYLREMLCLIIIQYVSTVKFLIKWSLFVLTLCF